MESSVTPVELCALLLLLPLLALVVSGNGWGLVGVGLWWLTFGTGRSS